MNHSIFYLLHSSSQISALFAHRLLHHHQHKVLGFVTLSSMKSNVMTDSDCILIAYLQFSAFPVCVKVFFKAPAQSPWGVALADFWEVCTPCFHSPGTRQPALLLCSSLPGATIHSCSEVHVVILYVALEFRSWLLRFSLLVCPVVFLEKPKLMDTQRPSDMPSVMILAPMSQSCWSKLTPPVTVNRCKHAIFPNLTHLVKFFGLGASSRLQEAVFSSKAAVEWSSPLADLHRRIQASVNR